MYLVAGALLRRCAVCQAVQGQAAEGGGEGLLQLHPALTALLRAPPPALSPDLQRSQDVSEETSGKVLGIETE